MDIITLYNYKNMKSQNISGYSTFPNMIDDGNWELDPRSKDTTMIFKKIFELKDGSIYRVVLRFSQTNSYEGIYTLDQPAPFIIMRTERIANQKGFKDIEVFHGRKAKNILGYINLGIPLDLFAMVSNDLKQHIKYTQGVLS